MRTSPYLGLTITLCSEYLLHLYATSIFQESFNRTYSIIIFSLLLVTHTETKKAHDVQDSAPLIWFLSFFVYRGIFVYNIFFSLALHSSFWSGYKS